MAIEPNYKTKETTTVLGKILELMRFSPEGELLIYRIENFFAVSNHRDGLRPEKEDEILDDLERWGALKIENREHVGKQMHYYLNVLPKFERVYQDHLPNKKTDGQVSSDKESRIDIFIDQDDGIYRFDDSGKKLSYSIEIKSGRWRMLMILNDNRKMRADQLLTIYKTTQLISAAIKETNRLFQKRLEVSYPLVVHLATGGYKLNEDHFNIVFKTARSS